MQLFSMRMMARRVLGSLTFAALLVAAGSAAAQTLPPRGASSAAATTTDAYAYGDCLCTLSAGRVPLAQLLDVQGTVRITMQQGFTPVTSGVALVAGDRIIFQDGNALLSAGPNCQVPVGPNLVLNMRESNDAICAMSEVLRPQEGMGGNKGLIIGAGAAAAAGLGIGLIFATSSKKDSPVSP